MLRYAGRGVRYRGQVAAPNYHPPLPLSSHFTSLVHSVVCFFLHGRAVCIKLRVRSRFDFVVFGQIRQAGGKKLLERPRIRCEGNVKVCVDKNVVGKYG